MTEASDITDNLTESLKSVNLSNGASPHPSSIPRTMVKSYQIDGIATDLWVQVFRERLVFGVSQYKGSIGNFVMCEPTQSPINMKQVHYEVTNLLGAREEPVLNVYAQQLCEKIISIRDAGEPLLTIVLGISLHKEKGKEPSMFRAILDLLGRLYQDALQE
jgi:hypothetical protein